jgi:hypothetical protein
VSYISLVIIKLQMYGMGPKQSMALMIGAAAVHYLHDASKQQKGGVTME